MGETNATERPGEAKLTNCERCTFKKWIRTNPQKYKWVDGHRVRVWMCAKCSHLQAEAPPFIAREGRILYVDIETSLISTMSWGLHVPSKYINPALLLKPYFIITWSASWIGERRIYSGAVTGRQAKAGNDKQCLKELWKLIDQADLVAGHNSDKFDVKRIQTRMILNGYKKPRQFRTLDTLKIAKKHFAFLSNKLEHINLQFGHSAKHDMDLEDWMRICLDGDERRIEKMRRYNEGDVREGKRLLEKFLPWIYPYPAVPRGGYK